MKLKRILIAIRRWLDRPQDMWYVRYRDGKRSVSMNYDGACHYAELFNGKVYHFEDKEPQP